MAKVDQNPSVRPLDSGPTGRPNRREARPPQLVLVVMLLATGGLIGWLVGSTGGGDTIASPVADSGEVELAPLTLVGETSVDVEWVQATALPAAPSGMEYAGVSNAVEVAGTIYVVVNWWDPNTDEQIGYLWISADGREWRAEPINVGQPVAAYDIEAVGDGLLLAGRSGGTESLWRSVPDRAISGSSWTEVPLGIPETVHRDMFGTAVTTDGDILVTMLGYLDIVSELIGPYLPAGVDLDDERYSYDGGQFIYTSLPPDRIQIFGEHPEVVVAGDNVWIRLVTLEGEEVLQTVPLPEAAHPVPFEPRLGSVPLNMAWVAPDGVEFVPVLGENALPGGFFLPEAWADGFVGSVYEWPGPFATDQDVTLWGSQSGQAWRPQDPQPPHECSPYRLVVGGDRILLTQEGGVRCVRDSGTEWAVITEPGESAYVVGGAAGFIGYPNAFEYDAALFSRDGLSWERIEIPGLEPYPTLSVLEERLMVLSVGRPRATGPLRIGIWLGEPAA